jgi:hypothetical protein
LVQIVVDTTAELLAGINQLPVTKREELPSTIISWNEQAIKKVTSTLRRDRSPKTLIFTGMGGIGKTTLAKLVFNELQDSDPTALCHFLRLDPRAKDDTIMTKQQEYDNMVMKQQELLNALTCMVHTKITSTDDGQAQLLKHLAGKRVLLVVDNVWGGQLVALLGRGILRKLGDGSVVLVTSRESGCVEEHEAEELQMEFLSDLESNDLLCKHAFNGSSFSSLADEDKLIVQALVARCGGLPMAVEVVGRHLAGVSNRRIFLSHVEEELAFAYGHVAAGRLEEKHRTLFEELQLSQAALDSGEKEALLDIVWFLQGQPWEMVGAYCSSQVLDKLHKHALVLQHKEVGADRVHVHQVMVDFCKLGAISSHEGQRLELDSDEVGSDPIWEELSMVRWPVLQSCLQRAIDSPGCCHVQVGDARGLHLRGHVLDTEGCRALSELEELRVLWLSKCSIVCSAQLLLSQPGLSHLGWLSLEGPGSPQLPSMLEASLQLQASLNIPHGVMVAAAGFRTSS